MAAFFDTVTSTTTVDTGIIRGFEITERNKQKGRAVSDSALAAKKLLKMEAAIQQTKYAEVNPLSIRIKTSNLIVANALSNLFRQGQSLTFKGSRDIDHVDF